MANFLCDVLFCHEGSKAAVEAAITKPQMWGFDEGTDSIGVKRSDGSWAWVAGFSGGISGTQNYLPKFGAGGASLGDSAVSDNGGDVNIKLGDALGVKQFNILDSGDVNVANIDSDGNAQFDGTLTVSGMPADDATYTGIVTYDSGELKYRTKAEILSDIGAAASGGISGTQNYVAKFGVTGATVGDSRIIDDGTHVGIGTTPTDGTLHILTASAGAIAANTNYDEIVIESNSAHGISFLGATSQSGGLAWGRVGNNVIGWLVYDHGYDQMTIGAGNTAIVYVGANGPLPYVGIGVDDPDTKLEVFNETTQIKLSHDATSFVTLGADANSDLTIVFGESGSCLNLSPTVAGTAAYLQCHLNDLAHGITDYLPTDCFLKIAPNTSDGGGVVFTAATEIETPNSVPMTFRGINDGTNFPCFVFDGGEKNMTGYQSTAIDLVQIENAGTAKLKIGPEGILTFAGTMGNSTKNPTTDAPADWVQVVIGSTTYYLPAYAAA